jgi:hypothetical protein
MRVKETMQYGESEKKTMPFVVMKLLVCGGCQYCTAHVNCGVLSRRERLRWQTQVEMGSRKFSTEIFAFDCISEKKISNSTEFLYERSPAVFKL